LVGYFASSAARPAPAVSIIVAKSANMSANERASAEPRPTMVISLSFLSRTRLLGSALRDKFFSNDFSLTFFNRRRHLAGVKNCRSGGG
jgi:hypothetical protein